MIRSKFAAGGHAVGALGPNILKSLMKLNIVGVGGFLGCGHTGATGFILDPRNTSGCRGILSATILIFRECGVFENNLTTFDELLSRWLT